MQSRQSTTAARGQYARSEDTRARILDAALALASEGGLQKVSVARIAARADVAVGNLNYHFGSKKRLLTELMASRMEDFLSRVAPPAEGDDFFTYETSLLRTYVEFLHANPTYVRLAEEIRHHDPALYQAGMKSHVEQIVGRLRKGISQGDLRRMSDEELLAQAYLLQGAYTFLDRFLEADDYPGDDVLLSSISNLLKGGLGRR
jgi:AcrR family transcriptional regulator